MGEWSVGTRIDANVVRIEYTKQGYGGVLIVYEAIDGWYGHAALNYSPDWRVPSEPLNLGEFGPFTHWTTACDALEEEVRFLVGKLRLGGTP